MFIDLVESNRKPSRSVGGTLASVALHTGLISIAIVATANARTKQEEVVPQTKLIWIDRVDARPAQSSPTPPRHASITAAPSVSQVAIPAPVSVPTGIPEITVAQPSTSFSSDPLAGAPSTGSADGTGSAEPAGPLTELQVDRPVRPFSSNRSPVYPDILRSQGIEGEVYARFVVDENGRVDMKTFQVLSASSPAFSTSVRHALERARFQPAEASGRKVAQLVEQRFQFRLDR